MALYQFDYSDLVPLILNKDVFDAEWEASLDKRLLLNILDSIPDGILILDKNSKVCYINDGYTKIFGVTRQKLVGRYLSKFEPLAKANAVLTNQSPLYGTITHSNSGKQDVISDIVPLFHEGQLIGSLSIIKNIVELDHLNQELQHFKYLNKFLKDKLAAKNSLPPPFASIIGGASSLINVLQQAARISPTDASVLISGESGVGKEVLAEAVHYSSLRGGGPFIKINCAAIPESLLESELFGYESGAFTGARPGGRAGKFEQASGGTIFLDEIGEMPLSMQVKLLRVLQEKEVERVGGSKRIRVDFRLITATNRDLYEMIEEGTFRKDLFYRLNVIPLVIPPLRERRDDIILLANYFLDQLRENYRRELQFSNSTLSILNQYDWPGNVRELKNCIEQSALLCPDLVITPDYLPEKLRQLTSSSYPRRQETYKLHTLVEKTEREAIVAALNITGNNKTKAMALLGISRRIFYAKVKKYGIPL